MVSTSRHLRSIATLPLVVTVVIPIVILAAAGNAHPGWGLPTSLAWLPIACGILLVAVGLGLFAWTNRLFGRRGRGTLAPWDPPRRLVVAGPYRHVRNPMISSVLFVLLGEAVAFGSLALLGWFLVFATFNACYFPLKEEPSLAERFGADYVAYRRHVPRWVPQLRPWDPPQE